MPAILLAFALAAAAAPIPRFEIPPSQLALEGPARPAVYLEASGRRAAFLGREDGSFEAWVYPMKILRGFELAFEVLEYAAPVPGASLATEVEVRPEASTVRYAHSSFTADATWLVPIEEPGGVVLLDVETSEPFTLLVRFHTALELMWPAGLGGQYSFWDRGLDAFVLTESTRRHAALVGSPLALDSLEQPAHNLPDAPTEMRIPVTPELARRGLVPIVIAASDEGLAAARRTYDRLLTETASLYESTAMHYRSLHESRTRIDSPDDELDLALEWGKVALDKGFACNPKLGCGLVAGLGPSGRSERPGFGWYFGGDAFINSWATTAYGDFETVRESLVFLSKRQREDGKMMHELSQGAAYIPWFEEFPYGYYHADTTPLYIVAVADYVEASGDVDFAREIFPSIRKAYSYCESTDEDGDGLMDNSKAGLAAVETGALRSEDVLTDVYLASVWTEAAGAASSLARTVGDDGFAAVAARAHERALASLNRRFPDDENGVLSFALLKSGTAQPEVTVWPAFGLWRDLFEARPAVEGALDALASSRLGADWGARMLSRESALYDHESYNNGAVWPFLSGLAALALYEHGRPEAAFAYVDGTKALTLLGARGYVPELLSGDRMTPLDAAVPHQLFAAAGLVSPLLRGLVGLDRGKLSPRIPAGWDRLSVRNLRSARGLFDLEWTRTRERGETRQTLRLVPPDGGELPRLDVELALPPGATPIGGSPRWRTKPGPGAQRFESRYRGGVEIEPLHDDLRMGNRSSRLRVLERSADMAKLEGRSGRSYRLRVRGSGELAIENGREIGRSGDVREVEVSFPEAAGEWSRLDLALRPRR
jgi:glycogen debranching enzyme